MHRLRRGVICISPLIVVVRPVPSPPLPSRPVLGGAPESAPGRCAPDCRPALSLADSRPSRVQVRARQSVAKSPLDASRISPSLPAPFRPPSPPRRSPPPSPPPSQSPSPTTRSHALRGPLRYLLPFGRGEQGGKGKKGTTSPAPTSPLSFSLSFSSSLSSFVFCVCAHLNLRVCRYLPIYLSRLLVRLRFLLLFILHLAREKFSFLFLSLSPPVSPRSFITRCYLSLHLVLPIASFPPPPPLAARHGMYSRFFVAPTCVCTYACSRRDFSRILSFIFLLRYSNLLIS